MTRGKETSSENEKKTLTKFKKPSAIKTSKGLVSTTEFQEQERLNALSQQDQSIQMSVQYKGKDKYGSVDEIKPKERQILNEQFKSNKLSEEK